MSSSSIGERSSRQLPGLIALATVFRGVHTVKLSHTSSTGVVFVPFWIVFIYLTVVATISFVLGYIVIANRRRTIVRGIFESPEFELLDDYENVPANSDWINAGLLCSKARSGVLVTSQDLVKTSRLRRSRRRGGSDQRRRFVAWWRKKVQKYKSISRSKSTGVSRESKEVKTN
ncbi:hypothetical protein RB195_005552 [Necator americanus]|uniref:Uncharacterized protein n=1 Tax=Necator americanus TaxID=51031 RepID=A0ABR1BNG7_NECAM